MLLRDKNELGTMPGSAPGARALIPEVCIPRPPTPSPKVQTQTPLASCLFPGPLAEGGPPDSFTFRFFPQIRSLMLFPARVKLFAGDGGRESILRLGIRWSLLPGRARRRPKQTKHYKMHPMGVFPLRLDCRVAADSRSGSRTQPSGLEASPDGRGRWGTRTPHPAHC